MTAARKRRMTLFAMCLSQGMILLDITIVNIALPSIQRELHMSPGLLEWVISAYALSLATFIPLGGTLGDRYGRKRVFLVGLVVFTLASAACALSTVDVALISFRVVQGVGGAVMSALTLSILSETYPPETRASAIGMWSAIAGLGFGLGPVVGGLLLSSFGWSSIFWVNVPVGLVAFGVTVYGVAESRDPVTRRLDVVGVVLSALGLLGVTYGFVEAADRPFSSTIVWGPVALGLVLLVAFWVWERRCPSPMAPPSLLSDRRFGTACSVFFLAYLALASVMFFATLLFQNVKGWSALHTGLSWMAMNVPFIVVAQLSGRINRRFSSAATVVAGCLVAAGGVLALSQVTTTTPFVLAGAGYVLLGAGYGALAPAIANVAMRNVAKGSSGIAAGILNTSRQVGTSVGLGIVGFLGVSAAAHAWSADIGQLPAASQAAARGLAQSVAGGRVGSVTHQLGAVATGPATAAFLHGYEVAIVVCGAALLVAGALAAVGLRHRSGARADVPASGAVGPMGVDVA
ncbi:MAG: MFS transporter [Acidimicrobiales bacterium]